MSEEETALGRLWRHLGNSGTYWGTSVGVEVSQVSGCRRRRPPWRGSGGTWGTPVQTGGLVSESLGDSGRRPPWEALSVPPDPDGGGRMSRRFSTALRTPDVDIFSLLCETLRELRRRRPKSLSIKGEGIPPKISRETHFLDHAPSPTPTRSKLGLSWKHRKPPPRPLESRFSTGETPCQ